MLKKILNFSLLFYFTLIGVVASAEQVSIKSDFQSLSAKGGATNLQSNFSGNVYVNYGNGKVTLSATNVIVSTVGNSKRIIATGSPVIVDSPSQQFNLTANRVEFDLGTNIVSANNATVVYKGNKLISNSITYNVKNQNLVASGTKSKQVETILKTLPNKN